MAIEIMNNYNNYAKDYTNTARKSDSTKESNVTTSTV